MKRKISNVKDIDPGETQEWIESVEDVDDLLRLKDEEQFDRYLEILLLPKLILTDKQAHKEAAYHMASELFHSYNVGSIRLKFTFFKSCNGFYFGFISGI